MEPGIKQMTYYLINVGGSYVWKVPGKDVVEKGGTEFVKLSPWAYGFVRLVADGIVDIDAKAKLSLGETEGLATLVKLRNEAQASSLLPKCSLFDSPAVKK